MDVIFIIIILGEKNKNYQYLFQGTRYILKYFVTSSRSFFQVTSFIKSFIFFLIKMHKSFVKIVKNND